MPDYNLGTARGTIEIDSSGVEKGTAAASKSVNDFTKNSEKASGTLVKTGTAMAGVGALAVAGFGVAVNAAANFEKGISAIGAVSGATEADLERARKKALQLGADTKFSAGEAASAMEELVKAGLSIEDVLNGAADATVNLAAAGEVDLVTAATISSNAMNQFGLAAENLPKVADLIAGAANASAIDVGEFGMSLSQAGATANLVGLSFDDLAVAIAAMGNAGIKGSDAGTSLKTFLANLQPTTDKQIALMEELGIVTEDGANKFFDAQGKIKSMSDVAGVLSNALKGMTDQQKTLALETLFGSDAIRAAAIIADNGSAGFDKLATSMGKVTAQEVAEKRMDNLAGSIEQLKGSLETALISAGAPFQQVVRSIVDGITKIVNMFASLSPGTQKLIITIALAVAALVGLAGVFTLVVGGALKFINAFKQFKAALQFVKGLKMMQGAMTALNASFLTNPVFLVVAAIVALVAIFILAYKKIKPFRDFIDSLWQNLQKLWDAILGGAKAAGRAIAGFAKSVMGVIGGIIDWIKRNWDLLLPIFLGPIGAIILIWRRFGDQIKSIVSSVVGAVINFFQALPGRVIGFVVAMVTGVINFIAQLPYKIGYTLGLIIGSVIRFGVLFVQKGIELAIKFVQMVIQFLMQLPGRMLTFYATILSALAGFVVSVVGKAIELGSKFLSNVVRFITQLPGKFASMISDVAGKLLGAITRLGGIAGDIGMAIFNGIKDAVMKIPGMIGDMIKGAVGKLKDGVGGLLGAAKDFGGGLVKGFVGSVFGSPKTKIEYWIDDMVDAAIASTASLKGEVSKWSGVLSKTPPTPQIGLAVAQGAGVVSSGAGGKSAADAAASGSAIGQVNIYNPKEEPAEESLLRTGEQLSYLGAFG